MKNQLALPSIVAGTTILGALSYIVFKPGKSKSKKTKKVFVTTDETNECFI